MKKNVVVIDIDGVLSDFNRAAREELIRFGAQMREFEDGVNPRMWDWFVPYGATKEQERAFWEYVSQYPEWWGKLNRHPDTFAQLDGLPAFYNIHNSRHDVYFVTSRPAGSHRATRIWLHSRFPDGGLFNVVVTPRHKHLALIAMTPKVIIEDKLETLHDYACHKEASSRTKLILVNRPYNQGDSRSYNTEALARIKRVTSTVEALKEAMVE